MALFFETYVLLSALIFVYMTAWFGVALAKKRNDIVDIAWGLGFLLVAVVSFVRGGLSFDRGFLVTCLVAVWAMRLSWHIWMRNRGKKEDYRYKAWREQWGKSFYARTFFQVFMLQGFLLLLVVIPVVVINVYRGANLSWVDAIGVVVWVIGFLFETISDRQLAVFIKDPHNKGKIMKIGLWQYTRHPNYFGEVAQWWGIWLVALSVPFWWVAIIGPLTISILILKVSGIPLLERKMENNPEFLEYKKRTSVFFPLPKRGL